EYRWQNKHGALHRGRRAGKTRVESGPARRSSEALEARLTLAGDRFHTKATAGWSARKPGSWKPKRKRRKDNEMKSKKRSDTSREIVIGCLVCLFLLPAMLHAQSPAETGAQAGASQSEIKAASAPVNETNAPPTQPSQAEAIQKLLERI